MKVMLHLSPAQIAGAQQGLANGFMDQSHGLVGERIARRRQLHDEVRGRMVPTGDFELTAWGREVAANYKQSTPRLPVGTRLNHRIHRYWSGTVVLADDSDNRYMVDTGAPLRVRTSDLGRSSTERWSIPLRKGGYAIGSPEECWYLRNHFDLSIEVTFD